MARKPRNETGPGTYHVFARGNRGDVIFMDRADHLSYLVGLAVTRKDRGWRILSWCLMVNHMHLILETTKANLGEGMRWFHGNYARDFNERHGYKNHLFGDRYQSVRILDDDHLRTAVRYVAHNPVKAGLAAAPGDWPWCSRPGPPRVDEPEELIDQRQLLRPFGCLEAYEAFVRWSG